MGGRSFVLIFGVLGHSTEHPHEPISHYAAPPLQCTTCGTGCDHCVLNAVGFMAGLVILVAVPSPLFTSPGLLGLGKCRVVRSFYLL